MEELDLKELMFTVWRKKWIIIVLIVVFTIVGAIYSYSNSTPMYQSSSTIILGKIETSSSESTNSNLNTSALQEELDVNSSLIETYTELVQSRTLIERVEEKLGVSVSASSISVSRVNSSSLIEITVSNEDPTLACKILTEVVSIFSEYVQEIYNISNVYVIDEANVPTSPYNINHTKDILIFTAIGLVIALAYVLLYFIIDNTVKNEEDIEKCTNTKALISIPIYKKKTTELVTIKESKAVISEVFKTLRTNIQFGSINSREQKTLLITSCSQEEGKSFISANLAITFAQTGKKVMLVDADMRKGKQATIFQIQNKYGLSNYISNMDINGNNLNLRLEEYINKTDIENLDMMTSGDIPPNPSELLETGRIKKLIEELKKRYDVVIFDGAPILPVTDSLLLARLLENTVIISAFNKTKKDDLAKVKKEIEDVGGKVIGACLNKVESISSNGYNNKYYYYSQNEEKGWKKVIHKVQGKLPKKKEEQKTDETETDDTSVNFVETPEVNENYEIPSQSVQEKGIYEKPELEEEIKEDKTSTMKQSAFHDEENIVYEQESVEESILMDEDKFEQEAELAEQKARKEEERLAVQKAKEELKKQKAEEFRHKVNMFKGKILVKKDEIAEEIAIKKQEFSERNAEKKAIRAEQNKIKSEQKAQKNAEIIKIREEEKARRAEERAKREQELALQKAEAEARMAEEKAKQEEREKARIAEEKAEQGVDLYPKNFNNL